MFNVISAYAPHDWLTEHFKVKFWEELEGLVQDIPKRIFLGWELNGDVGSISRGREGVHGVGMTLGR